MNHKAQQYCCLTNLSAALVDTACACSQNQILSSSLGPPLHTSSILWQMVAPVARAMRLLSVLRRRRMAEMPAWQQQ